MAGEYFDKFPDISYNNVLVKDVTKRVKFLKETLQDPYSFLPYTIKEGERAEDIAYHYYGDSNYTWLIYLANNIIDPYNEWPMDEYTFNQYLISKYSGQAGGLNGYDLVDWTKANTNTDNIVYYYKEV
jgi:hypothetical protein